jgi:uncharacterized integral membrane protein
MGHPWRLALVELLTVSAIMARTPRLYQKLVGWRGSIGSRFSLWLGEGHVLLAEGNMMTERYQRVWLRDIQGFLVRPSNEARWVTAIGAGLVLLFAVLALTLVNEDAVMVCWVFAAMSAPILLYGLISARTCRFYVVTAVQRTEWPNVARRRKARKLLARLDPLIREIQLSDFAAAVGAVADGGSVPTAGSDVSAGS